MLENYFLTCASVIIVCHIIILYFGVAFPFRMRWLENSGYTRHMHVTVVVVSLLLPFGPALVPFSTGGFVNDGSPPNFCIARGSWSAFVSLILPNCIYIGVSITMSILVVHSIIKVLTVHV